MDSSLKDFLQHFFALEIIPGKKVRIPYWCNKLNLKSRKRIQGPFGGKGTPAEIKKATLEKAKEAAVDLKKLSSQEIRSFMKQKRIGIDCSGFAFQVLNFLQPGFWKKLKKAPGKSSNPVRRFSAAVLTGKENSSPVKKVADIKVGDLIPLTFKGKKTDHVLIVVDVSSQEIVYAHSSSMAPIAGPHLGRIKIKEKNQGLDKQEWQEKDRKEINLSFYLAGKEARRIKGMV